MLHLSLLLLKVEAIIGLYRLRSDISPGPNGVCMEVFMYGGLKLLLHLSLFLHAV